MGATGRMAAAVGLNVGRNFGEMAPGQQIAPVAGAVHSAHLGVAHLPLNQKANLFLHAAVIADGQMPQALIGLIREHPQAQ